MIIKTINILLLLTIIVNAFFLVNKRYQSRTDYEKLTRLQAVADGYNKEYTRLQLEEGTFSSRLVLEKFAFNQLGLVEPDKKRILEVKSHVSQ